jgi:hypothetical protein
MGIPWFVSTESERQKFEAGQRARMEKKFPLIECGSEYTQCFKIVPYCGIREF